ncbi:MAG: hypothetical protein KIT35_21900 [Piscinibacter sp.]|uniref:hypothetical protein n=1 Tax=Piscinibacter sp. TaxID=1903157 RepID=UPI00258BEAFD|nr:hypothetical protein [Piscinibacter sp.]MCW5666494.1 hypothetical protein [Piscinibacter sp.]
MSRTEGARSRATCAPGLQQAWTSMRVLRRFTTAELEATGSLKRRALQEFCRVLHGARYLRLVQPRVSGRPGSYDVWQLVRDSGPVAPVRRKDGETVYDRNTGAVWNLKGERIAEAAVKAEPWHAWAREAVARLEAAARALDVADRNLAAQCQQAAAAGAAAIAGAAS